MTLLSVICVPSFENSSASENEFVLSCNMLCGGNIKIFFSFFLFFHLFLVMIASESAVLPV